MKVTLNNPEAGDARRGTRARAEEWLDRIPSGPLAVLFAAIGVILTLRSHFWVDETHTYWVISGGLKELLARSTVFAVSFAYVLLMLAVHSLGATSEWALRLPSFLAVLAAGFILFRGARKRWGSSAAWFAVAIFSSLPGVRFAAGDARPYAFGLLLVVLSTWRLPGFLERPGLLNGLWYCLPAGGALYFHLFFGTALMAHAAYFVVWLWQGNRIRTRYIAAACGFLTVGMLPLLALYYSVISHPAAHSFAMRPSQGDLLTAFLPIPVAVCVGTAVACAILLSSEIELNSGLLRGDLMLALLLAAVPPMLCFAASRVSSANVFVARYWISSSVGLSCFCGVLFTSVSPKIVSRLMLLGLAAVNLAMLFTSGFQHTGGGGDWGSAIAYVDRNTAADRAPVLIRSQYVESDTLPLEPIADNILFTQLAYYPSKARLFGIGATLQEKEKARIDNLLAGELKDAKRFLLLSFDGPHPLDPLLWYLTGKLGEGVRVRQLGFFDGTKVIEFALPFE